MIPTTLPFEISIPFGELDNHMARERKIQGRTNPVLIRGKIDKISGLASGVSLIPSSDSVDDSDNTDYKAPTFSSSDMSDI